MTAWLGALGAPLGVSPLWTLQRLRFRPDQMLRRHSPTAERTMTRAGDTIFGLTAELRLENGPLSARVKLG